MCALSDPLPAVLDALPGFAGLLGPDGVITEINRFALDLTGLSKGLAWLNGQCIGRYWLCPVAESRLDDWQRDAGLLPGPAGVPTQRYYHLPADWLRPRNTVTLFEERGGGIDRIRLCRWK